MATKGTILVHAEGFPSGTVANGAHSVPVDERRLLWAAVTVGKQSWLESRGAVGARDAMSRAEADMRVSMIQALLAPDPVSGRYRLPDRFANLDGSEKSAMSFFLGLVTAKLLAWHFLAVPYALHLSKYRHQFKATFLPGPRYRPDFIGLDRSGSWVVLEAKSRTTSGPKAVSDAVAKAKLQIGAVASVGGLPPSAGVAVVTHFPKREMTVEFNDPPPQEASATLHVSESKFLGAYYAPLAGLLEQGEVIPPAGRQVGSRASNCSTGP